VSRRASIDLSLWNNQDHPLRRGDIWLEQSSLFSGNPCHALVICSAVLVNSTFDPLLNLCVQGRLFIDGFQWARPAFLIKFVNACEQHCLINARHELLLANCVMTSAAGTAVARPHPAAPEPRLHESALHARKFRIRRRIAAIARCR